MEKAVYTLVDLFEAPQGAGAAPPDLGPADSPISPPHKKTRPGQAADPSGAGSSAAAAGADSSAAAAAADAGGLSDGGAAMLAA